ncbi:hypothetical protein QQP08_009960 [Theobroma cacao]|nr:hypothetical protein QQP08_009960 [Theobroma cacao]
MMMMMSSDSMDCSTETEEESFKSNGIEKTKISLMRTLVETQDPSSKPSNPSAEQRFWRFSFVVRF